MIRVRRSSIVDAPLATVWAVLRDFNAHERWHPAVAASRIEAADPADRVGAVRAFRLTDGKPLREQLIALSDRDHTLAYCLIESPIPLMNYVATMRLKSVTDGDRTFLDWQSSFTTIVGEEAAAERLVGEGIYATGLAAMRRLFERPASPASPDAAAPRRRPLSADSIAPALPRGATIETQAIVVDRHGGPEELRLRRIEVAPPGAGEVRIRQRAIGVNFIDVYCRTGAFDLLRPPGILGMEAAGVVIDVGPGVGDLRPGDRVAYACPPLGAYAGVRTMSAELLVPLPSDIDDETAAAVMLKGLTAEFLLHRVHRLAAGETVLVHAAAGGVGLLLAQWASRLGARVIGTVSRDEKAALARRHGCDHVVVRSHEGVADAVARLTAGRGADVVYDAIGRDTYAQSLAALARCGHLVSYGQASGPVENWDPSGLGAKSGTLSRPNFGHYTDDPATLPAMAARLFDMLRRGLVARINDRLPLGAAAEVHRRLEGGNTTGATILLPPS